MQITTWQLKKIVRLLFLLLNKRLSVRNCEIFPLGIASAFLFCFLQCVIFCNMYLRIVTIQWYTVRFHPTVLDAVACILIDIN